VAAAGAAVPSVLAGRASASSAAATAPAPIQLPGEKPYSSLKGKKYGVTIPFSAEFFDEFTGVMRKEGQKYGIQTTVVSQDQSQVKAHQQADTFIAQRFDAVCLQVTPVNGWESTVARATKQGMGVFRHLTEPLTGMTQVALVDHAG